MYYGLPGVDWDYVKEGEDATSIGGGPVKYRELVYHNTPHKPIMGSIRAIVPALLLSRISGRHT